MKLNRKIYTTQLDGEEISLEFSELAGQANASVIGRHGNTTVLATVVMGKEDTQGDYLPLTVDYEEKFYAVGKILGSRFMRREGRPSDDATLSARLIDRAIRPLFNQRLRREVQVVVMILEYDEKTDPDIIGLLSASIALAVSDIPWDGPVAGVKFTSGTSKESSNYYTSFFAGGKGKIYPNASMEKVGVNMIEFDGKEIAEETARKLFSEAQKKIETLIEFQKKIVSEIGKRKAEIMIPEPDVELVKSVHEFISNKIEETLKTKTVEQLKKSLFEHIKEKNPDISFVYIENIFEQEIDVFVHKQAIEKNTRVDGRKFDEIRDLYAEVGVLKRTHGSAIFTRGATQVLAVTTLASPSAEQLIETLKFSGKRRFMLNYNFPKFSTGETGRSRGPGRREIGHGALAMKAIANIIPSKEEFPYAIRVVAETLSSNGSSSMASTCSTCLSLMDAGVPLKKHVAGIAIGLMSNESGAYKILTDIQGPEDHYGDMDLKIAGTRNGITAIQMDVKINGITPEIFRDALDAGKKAREEILVIMENTLPKYRDHVSPFAPTIMTLPISQEKIGLVIGPGGKTINGIIAEVGGGIAIDIEQEGLVFVSGIDKNAVQKAYNIVKSIIRDIEIGEVVEGTVVKIFEFGAIVDLGGDKDGMIHVSELKNGFVKSVEEVLHIGDVVKAKVIRAENGKIGLSIKALEK